MKYVCIGCGATAGTPAGEGSENWFWITLRNGRLGPFHAETCSSAFRYPVDRDDTFTLEQHTKLIALQHRYEEGM